MPKPQILLAMTCAFFLVAVSEVLAGQGEVPPPSLEKIADNVWIHKSYKIVEPWGPVLSQGLVIDTDNGVILVDTAWTDQETDDLLQLIVEEAGALPAMAVVTHAHDDKMGGMAALHRAGVETYAHYLSNKDAPARGLSPAKSEMFRSGDFQILAIGGPAAEAGVVEADGVSVYYPGPGHTRDNIVVYYAPEKVLFGGCLIRPGASNTLGYTADGDISHWAQATRSVAERFPAAEIVIPSHGAAGGRELLDHTMALAEAARGR
jgi:glyoxylase-like metal-dependent hydrolase (beta-lactamase superfamily II)